MSGHCLSIKWSEESDAGQWLLRNKINKRSDSGKETRELWKALVQKQKGVL